MLRLFVGIASSVGVALVTRTVHAAETLRKQPLVPESVVLGAMSLGLIGFLFGAGFLEGAKSFFEDDVQK